MNAASQAADSNRNPAPAPSSRFHVSPTSALLWADALEYDLFVCLGTPARHPEPSRADREPLPRSRALPAGAHCPGCFQGFCSPVSGGDASKSCVQQPILLKQCSWLAGAEAWTLLLRLSGKRGWSQARKAPVPKSMDPESQEGGWQNSSRIPDPWGEDPAPREPGWIQTSPRASGLGAGDVITNHSDSFLGPFQKSLFFPALCCWIAEDDLEPEPSISQNGTVSQIARPKGPLDSSAQPPVRARPARHCLIRALMLQPLPSAGSRFPACFQTPQFPLSARSRAGEE